MILTARVILTTLLNLYIAGKAPVLVLLRPSSEHLLSVRAPGAQDRHGCRSTSLIVRGARARESSLLTHLALPGFHHCLIHIHQDNRPQRARRVGLDLINHEFGRLCVGHPSDASAYPRDRK